MFNLVSQLSKILFCEHYIVAVTVFNTAAICSTFQVTSLNVDQNRKVRISTGATNLTALNCNGFAITVVRWISGGIRIIDIVRLIP